MNSSNLVLVNLHGGLGNQLFQLFAARVLAGIHSNSEICFRLKSLGRYSRPAEYELPNILSSSYLSDINLILSPFQDLLLSLRLPKLISKLSSRDCYIKAPGEMLVLDSYFDNIDYMKNINTAILGRELCDLTRNIRHNLNKSSDTNLLLHLRLGDFFESAEQKTSFVVETLAKNECSACKLDIITNEEDLVLDIISCNQQLDPYKYNLVKSSGMTGAELMRVMLNYKKIYTNGSSLALWSAIIAKSEFSTTSLRHADFYSFLSGLKCQH